MTNERGSTLWPYWTPADDAVIDDALTLAGLKPGERFVDLGCGDGRVLEAAARRGATALGVELDPAMAREARRRLRPWGSQTVVEQQDILSVPLDADVVYAYLSPSALQRLAPRLKEIPVDTRLVTPWFQVPGWTPTARRGDCFLYRREMAGNEDHPSGGVGWVSAGMLYLLKPMKQFLVTAYLRHPGGPVDVAVSPDLEGLVKLNVGVGHLARPGLVAVDLIWAGRPEGSVAHGYLSTETAGTCHLFAYHHPTRWGSWPLTHEGCERFFVLYANVSSAGAQGGA